jgi:hypothetical protein
VTWRLKGRIVEPEEMDVGLMFLVADMHAVIEELL